jgi:hypothetical protein
MEASMSNPTTRDERPNATDESAENELRGDSLDGSERKRAAGHTAYEKKRNPDAVVRTDDEEDTLYNDGLELEDETPPLGTTGGDAKVI